jgi:hypothetical protein
MSPDTLQAESLDNGSDVKPVQADEKVDEYEDAEKNFQPKSMKFWTIMIGMYLSIFLVALVSLSRNPS